MDAAQRLEQTMADAGAREALVGVALIVGEVQRPLLAVGRRLLACHAQQRADEPSFGGRHPQQGAAARRCGQPVEDRLHLIGGGVPRRDQGVMPPRQAVSLAVADLPGPGLQVASPLLPRRGLIRLAAPASGLDQRELDSQPLAEAPAAPGIGRGGGAQPVVDVEGHHRRRPEQPDGHVQQAGRVAPAGDHRDERPVASEQAAAPNGVADLLGGPALSSRGRRQRTAPSCPRSPSGAPRRCGRTATRRRRRRSRRPAWSPGPRRRRRARRPAPPD